MKKNKLYYIIPFFIALLLAILAYNFYPIHGNYDLSKYYHLMDMIRIKDAETMIYLRNDIEVFGRLFMYIISAIGNYRLLQFFPVLIFYSIMLYIIFDYYKNYTHFHSKLPLIFICLLFVTLFRFVLIASSFRYSLAYAIFILGLYLDLVKKNKKKLIKLFYILPIFIHKSTIILLLFRLLVEIKNKKMVYILFGLFTLLFFFPNIIINMLMPFKDIPFLTPIINMIYGYLVVENMPIYLQLIFRVGQTIFLIMSGILCYENTSFDQESKKYILLMILMGVFSISLFKYFTVFMRMIDFVLFMSPVILFQLFEIFQKKYKDYYPYLLLILCVFIVCGIYIQAQDFAGMFF